MGFLMRFLAFCILLFPFAAYADISGANGTGLVGSVINAFQAASATWGDKMTGYALMFFGILMGSAFLWRIGIQSISGISLENFLAEFVKTLFTLGFFLYLLQYFTAIATTILQSFGIMANEASGFPETLNPSNMMDGGFSLFKAVWAQSSVWSPVDSTFALLLCVVIMFFLGDIAFRMIELLIGGTFLIYGGVFLMGFGATPWTSDIAINHLRKIIGTGVQYMGLIFIAGIGKGFVDMTISELGEGEILIDQMMIIAVATFLMFRLSSSVPGMLSSSVGVHSGVNTFSTSSFSNNFSSAVGAMTIAASAMSSMVRELRESRQSQTTESIGNDSLSMGGSFSNGMDSSLDTVGSMAMSQEAAVVKNGDGSYSYQTEISPKADPSIVKENLKAARQALGSKHETKKS